MLKKIKQLYFISISALLLFSCSEYTKEQAENDKKYISKFGDTTLSIEEAHAKKAFVEAYQKVISKTGQDTVTIKKIQNLYDVFMKTSIYNDSIKDVLSKVDDLENSELINRIFITEGNGNYLIDKMKTCYSLAQAIALSDKDRAEIQESKVNAMPVNMSSDQILDTYFKNHTPQMVLWTLYGINAEIFKIGTVSLHEY